MTRVLSIGNTASIMPTLSNFLPDLNVACQIRHPALEVNSNCFFAKRLRYPLTLDSSNEIRLLSRRYDFFIAEQLFAVDCWRAGVKYGVYLHGVRDALLLYPVAGLGSLISPLYRKAVAESSFVAVSTPNLLRYVKPIRPDAVVMGGPIDWKKFNESVNMRRRDGEPLVLLSLQNINRYKGIEVIWQALPMMHNRDKISLLQCDWGMGAEYRKLKLTAPYQVKFVPLIPHHRIIEYYRMADIVVGQMGLGVEGMVELEASACQIPVAVFNCDPAKPFLPRSASSSALARFLDLLIDNRKFRDDYSMRCQEYVRRHHQAEAVASRWRDLIASSQDFPLTSRRQNTSIAAVMSGLNQVGIQLVGSASLRKLL